MQSVLPITPCSGLAPERAREFEHEFLTVLRILAYLLWHAHVCWGAAAVSLSVRVFDVCFREAAARGSHGQQALHERVVSDC